MVSSASRAAVWFARMAVLLVFAVNLSCIISFLFFPERYIGAYELDGVPGTVALQGLAIAFLMWNATYPLVIINPVKYRAVFAIVLVQQLIGLLGESALLFGLGGGHQQLAGSIQRFIVFDGAGLVLMAASFAVLLVSAKDAG